MKKTKIYFMLCCFAAFVFSSCSNVLDEKMNKLQDLNQNGGNVVFSIIKDGDVYERNARTLSPYNLADFTNADWSIDFVPSDSSYKTVSETLSVGGDGSVSGSFTIPSGDYTVNVTGAVKSESYVYRGSTEINVTEKNSKDNPVKFSVAVSLEKTEGGKGSFSYELSLLGLDDEIRSYFDFTKTEYYDKDENYLVEEKTEEWDSSKVSISAALRKLGDASGETESADSVALDLSCSKIDNSTQRGETQRISVSDSENGATVEIAGTPYTYYYADISHYTPTLTFSKSDIPSGYYNFRIEVVLKTENGEYSDSVSFGDTLVEIADNLSTKSSGNASNFNYKKIRYATAEDDGNGTNGIVKKYPIYFENLLSAISASTAAFKNCLGVDVYIDSIPEINTASVPGIPVKVIDSSDSNYFLMTKTSGGETVLSSESGYSPKLPSVKGDKLDSVLFKDFIRSQSENLSLDNVSATLENTNLPGKVTFLNGARLAFAEGTDFYGTGNGIEIDFGSTENPNIIYDSENPFVSYTTTNVQAVPMFNLVDSFSDKYAVVSVKTVSSDVYSAAETYVFKYFVKPVATANSSVSLEIPDFKISASLDGQETSFTEFAFSKNYTFSASIDASEYDTISWYLNNELLGTSATVDFNSSKTDINFYPESENYIQCVVSKGNGWRSVAERFYYKTDLTVMSDTVLYSGSSLTSPDVLETQRSLKDFAIASDYNLYILSYSYDTGSTSSHVNRVGTDIYNGFKNSTDLSLSTLDGAFEKIAASKEYIIVFGPSSENGGSLSSAVAYKVPGIVNEISSVSFTGTDFTATDMLQSVFIDDENRLFLAYYGGTNGNSYRKIEYGELSFSGNITSDSTLTYTKKASKTLYSASEKTDFEFITDDTELTDMYVIGDKLYILAKNHISGGNGIDTSKNNVDYSPSVIGGTSNGALICYTVSDTDLTLDTSFNSTGYFGYSSDAANETARKNAFFGPSRFVARKPDGFVIADEGGYHDGTGYNAENFKNVNRLLTLDLEKLSWTEKNTDAEFDDVYSRMGSSYLYNGTDEIVDKSGNTIFTGEFKDYM